MKKRVHHAWFTIIEEDDATPLRLEDLRSNIENVLGHASASVTCRIEDIEHSEEPIDAEFPAPEDCDSLECQNYQVDDCDDCPYGP